MTVQDQSNLLTPSGPRFVIDGENIPFGAYQAIYHKITKKVDTIKKFYKDAYEIGFEDINNLNDRLNQALVQYQTAGINCEVSHSVKDGGSQSYSSFEKFKCSNLSIRECTSSLSYTVSFMIILPVEIEQAENIPQRFKIELIFDQDFYENSDEFIPQFMRVFAAYGNNIQYKLEYSDYAVAQALTSIIDKWVENLRTRKKSKYLEIALKLKMSLSYYIVDIAKSVPFIGAIFLILNIELTTQFAVFLIFWCTAFAHFGSGIIHYLFNGMDRYVDKMSPMTYLEFTNGDRDRKSKLMQKRNSTIGAIARLMSVMLAITLNLASSYIFSKIYP